MHGKQLFIDLVAFAENEYKGFKWVFDRGMDGNKELFKNTILNILETDAKTKQKIMGMLGHKTDEEYLGWVRELYKRLDDFMEVKP
jgi:hypothetical protein